MLIRIITLRPLSLIKIIAGRRYAREGDIERQPRGRQRETEARKPIRKSCQCHLQAALPDSVRHWV